MNFLAHPITKRGIYELVALNTGLTVECRAHDYSLEMLPVAHHFQVVAS